MAKKARNQRFEPELWSNKDAAQTPQPEGRTPHYEDIEGHRRIVSSLSAGMETAISAPRAPLAGGEEADGWPVHRTFFFVFAFNAAAWVAIIGAIYYAIS